MGFGTRSSCAGEGSGLLVFDGLTLPRRSKSALKLVRDWRHVQASASHRPAQRVQSFPAAPPARQAPQAQTACMAPEAWAEVPTRPPVPTGHGDNEARGPE